VQRQRQEHVLQKVVVIEHETTEIFLPDRVFDDLAYFIIAKIQVVDFCDKISRVFDPKLEHVGLSIFYDGIASEFILQWEVLPAEADSCLVEECLASHRDDVVILPHIHVGSCDPDFLRLQDLEVLPPYYSGLLELFFEEFGDDRAPNFTVLETVPVLLDVLLVESFFVGFHLARVGDVWTALSEFFALGDKVGGRSFVQGSCEVRHPDERLRLPIVE